MAPCRRYPHAANLRKGAHMIVFFGSNDKILGLVALKAGGLHTTSHVQSIPDRWIEQGQGRVEFLDHYRVWTDEEASSREVALHGGPFRAASTRLGGAVSGVRISRPRRLRSGAEITSTAVLGHIAELRHQNESRSPNVPSLKAEDPT